MASTSAALSGSTAVLTGRLTLRRLPLAAAITIALATMLNVALYLVFAAAGVMTSDVLVPTPAGAMPIGAVQVASNTILQMVLGALVLAAIIRFRPAKAHGTWQIVAGVVLLVTLLQPPLALADAPLGFILSLEAMHIAAGALAIWLLPALARTR